MPLHQFSNSTRVRNKQNASQVDQQISLVSSPVKQSIQRSSPQKNFLSKQMKQLTQVKIRLSDRQFQLKRLEEDCAVKLGTMQKQLTKEKNEKKQLMKECKEKVEEDRQYFETRIVKIEEGWKRKVSEAEESVRGEMLVKLEKEIKQLTLCHDQKICESQNNIQQLINKHITQKQHIIQSHTLQLDNLCSKLLQQREYLTRKYQQQLMLLKQHHSSQIQFYHKTQQQKSKQSNVVVKILTDKIRGMEQEIRLTKDKINQLNRDLTHKEQEILIERRAKEDYRLDKVCLQRKLTRLEPQYKQQYQQILTKTKQQYQASLQQHTNKSTQQLTHLQSLQHQSITNYQLQLEQMEERCKQVVTLHETIKSNEGDLKKIQVLEMKLLKKQMELEKQKDYVKMCKLELGNMDQIFQKMFQQAKLKSLKPKKHRLPSLLSVGQNRSTMDVYNNNVNESTREKKKFSIREVITKSKEIRQLNTDFAPYQ